MSLFGVKINWIYLDKKSYFNDINFAAVDKSFGICEKKRVIGLNLSGVGLKKKIGESKA